MTDLVVQVLGGLLLSAGFGGRVIRGGTTRWDALTAVCGVALIGAAAMDVPSKLTIPALGVRGVLLTASVVALNITLFSRGANAAAAPSAPPVVLAAILALTNSAIVLGVWRVAVQLMGSPALRTVTSLIVVLAIDLLVVQRAWARALGQAHQVQLVPHLQAQVPNLLGSYAVLSLFSASAVVVLLQAVAAAIRTRANLRAVRATSA